MISNLELSTFHNKTHHQSKAADGVFLIENN